ncbi:hypothetical protein ACMD2_25623, partial [Ananas comosus]
CEAVCDASSQQGIVLIVIDEVVATCLTCGDEQLFNMKIQKERITASKRGTQNKRWSSIIDDFLIPFLVEQAQEGLRVDKGFKRQAYVAAAKAVNERFNTSFDPCNVENHMRTLRTRYNEIKKCRDLSGTGWNEEQKVITLDGPAYHSYVQAHPRALEFLNRPIKHYDALYIICCDYHPKTNDNQVEEGRCVYGGGDKDQAESNQGEGSELPVNDGPSSSSSKGGAKRARISDDYYLSQLVTIVGALAEAIKKSTVHWSQNLYEKIEEIEGYNDKVIESAFDYLYEDEKRARLFMAKNCNMRRAWLERYKIDNNITSELLKIVIGKYCYSSGHYINTTTLIFVLSPPIHIKWRRHMGVATDTESLAATYSCRHRYGIIGDDI